MGPETATSLQSNVGNASLAAMLSDSGRLENPGLELEAEQEVEVDQDEAKTGVDEAFNDLLGALGARESLVASADLEDWQRLFGGDPDEEPPPDRRAPRIPRMLAPPVAPAQQQPEDPQVPLLHDIPLAMPPLGEVQAPEGDEHFDALWAWLRDPHGAVDAEFEPEGLVDDEGSLSRIADLATFVQRAFRSPLARSLASLGRPLPGGPGLAGQVARAGALVELGALCEPIPVKIANRACACALESDAPVHARASARLCMEERRLRADLICEVALYAEAEGEPDLAAIPTPSERCQALLAAGLEAAADPQPIPNPGRHAERHPDDSTGDNSTAEIDDLLRQLTGATPPSSELDYDLLGPVLKGADRQLLYAGRTQVELAAAGIALRRVAGRQAREPVRHLLLAVDRELRDVARRTATTLQELERLIGHGLESARPELDAGELRLDNLAARLRRLREAGFEALGTRHAESLSQGARSEEPSPTEPIDLDALEACELVGAGLARAEALEAGILIGSEAVRGLLRRGERLRRQGDSEAPKVLAEAARRAMIFGLPKLDWRARARTVRALAELGRRSDAEALLPRLERDGEGFELELARAALGLPGSHQALAKALGAPLRTGWAHDHIEGWRMVAEGYGGEARWEQADGAWAEAMRLTRLHGGSTAELSLMRAATLIRCGRPAQRHLEDAQGSPMTQVQLAAALLLTGHHLAERRPKKALASCERAWTLAIARRSWHAFACAAIDKAAALLQLDRSKEALHALEQALTLCRLRGEPGALLQARLMEWGSRS